jgi:hypothetical protein
MFDGGKQMGGNCCEPGKPANQRARKESGPHPILCAARGLVLNLNFLVFPAADRGCLRTSTQGQSRTPVRSLGARQSGWPQCADTYPPSPSDS